MDVDVIPFCVKWYVENKKSILNLTETATVVKSDRTNNQVLTHCDWSEFLKFLSVRGQNVSKTKAKQKNRCLEHFFCLEHCFKHVFWLHIVCWHFLQVVALVCSMCLLYVMMLNGPFLQKNEYLTYDQTCCFSQMIKPFDMKMFIC